MLWLAYAQGWSHEEIASAIGVKTGSLKAMLLRAPASAGGIAQTWRTIVTPRLPHEAGRRQRRAWRHVAGSL